MRIGILTFHDVPNFGAFLQVYALSKVIKNMGHSVSVINLPLLKAKRNFIGEIMFSVNNRSFGNYRKKFLNETLKVVDKNGLETLNFDFFVVGSDQVWNKSITKENKMRYFFDFLEDDVKRISYAASFGQKDWMFDDEETKEIKKLVNRFSGVSVRESQGKIFCEDLLGIKPQVVLDPTLLLDDYSELISKPDVKSDKVVCFKFSRDSKFYEFAKKFKKEGYEILELRGVKPFKGTSIVPFPTIGDWLHYIKNGLYVLTDSFHGVCFSIIFKKNFIVIPADITKFNRIENLLKSLGLEDRIHYSYDEILNSERWKEDIDYDIVYKKLEVMRSNSIDFIKSYLR